MNTCIKTPAPDRLRWTIRFADASELQVTRALVVTSAHLTGANAGALIHQAVVKLLTDRYGATFTQHLAQAHQIAMSKEITTDAT